MNIREKIEAYGASQCSIDELLTCAVGSSAEVKSFTDLEQFIEGLTPAKRGQMKALLEITRRLDRERLPSYIRGPEDAKRIAASRLRRAQVEHFCVILLTTKNKVLRFEVISKGSLTASVVHPRETFRPAVIHHAAAIILVHNHPSGDPTPSKEDIAVTQKLVKAGRVMDIPVLDHIIIGDGRYTSLKSEDLMNG